LSDEWATTFEAAPMEIRIVMMLGRYAGLRGQTIVEVKWKQYVDHPLIGKAFRFIARNTRKRNPEAIVPATIELQEFLASLEVRTPDGRDCPRVRQPRVIELKIRLGRRLR
jgi:hypothetical protein